MVWFRNSSWHPKGGYHNEWGLRGPAWVTRHLFTDSISYVDLNITRAVRVSQSVDVRAYHRRVFAAWSTSPTYLLWDAIDAPAAVCANATYNLHVITSLLDQPRNTTEAPADVEVDEELPGGAATVRVRQGADAHGSPQTTLYLLGSRPAGSAKLLSGVEPLSSEAVAAVVGWTTPAVANATDAEAKKGTVLEHVELIDGKLLQLSTPKLRIALSTLGTVTIDRLGFNQYRLKQHSEVALVVELTLPWRDASTKRVAARGLQRPPRVANVWRGAHVWHSANSSGTDEQAAVTFEALPGEEYLVETQCRWVEEGAGYGEGGWLCDEFE